MIEQRLVINVLYYVVSYAINPLNDLSKRFIYRACREIFFAGYHRPSRIMKLNY